MRCFLATDTTAPEANAMMAQWLSMQVFGHMTGFQPPYSTLGVFRGDELVAVMLYNNFHRSTGVVEIHGAATTARWLTRPVLREMFGFPFDGLKCQTVVMRVSERDTRLLRILTAYGFEHVVVPRLRGRDEGERIFWLTDEAWRSNGFHKEAA